MFYVFLLAGILTANFGTIVTGNQISNFSTSLWSNVRSGDTFAYLNAATDTDGCTSIPIPPNSQNWILILEGFDTCPLNKIAHAREAGYIMLFTYTLGDTINVITDAVEGTNFPVVILTEEYGTQLLSTTYPGTIYIDVSWTNNNTVVYLTVYAEERTSTILVTATTQSTISESSLRQGLNAAQVIGISVAGVITFLIIIALVIVTLGVVLHAVVRARKKVKGSFINEDLSMEEDVK